MATRVPKVLVQVSVTEDDVLSYKHSLLESFVNLRKCEAASVYFLVVYQTESGNECRVHELSEDDVEIIHSPVFSVSRARNIGIEYARKNNFDYILFHDASLVFSPSFLRLARASMSLEDNVIVRGKMTENKENLSRGNRGRKVSSYRVFRVMPYPYTWLYLFPLREIETIRFNTEMGPGKNLFPNCGEDAMFLLDYFSVQAKKKVVVDHDALVFHPPRNADKSKQLGYARGQGRLYRILLRRKSLPYHIYFCFIFFVVNSVRYAVLSGKTGRLIFRERWKGFWQKQPSEVSNT